MTEIKLGTNERGFAIGKFQDLYGHPCSVQKSSLATDDAIWLGRDNIEHARMHLDRELVAALLPLLQRFIETGELEP